MTCICGGTFEATLIGGSTALICERCKLGTSYHYSLEMCERQIEEHQQGRARCPLFRREPNPMVKSKKRK